jgi:hypothetical protein
MLMASAALLSLDIPTAALVTVCRGHPQPWQRSPTVALSGIDGASARVRLFRIFEVGGRVSAKRDTLSLSEGIRLPRVHYELGGSEQTLQRMLGRIGRILLEDLLQIDLEQSVRAIILVRVMEVTVKKSVRLGLKTAARIC